MWIRTFFLILVRQIDNSMKSKKKVVHKKGATPHRSQQETEIHEDEINLREYIEVILGRKKLIFQVFLICVILAGLVSLFLPKVYEATASIMVLPSKIQSVLSPKLMSLDPERDKPGAYAAQKPTISISTHRTLLKSNAVLQRVTDKLKSGGILDEDSAIERLSERLKVKDVKDTEATNVLQFAVKGKDPCEVTAIVNTWAQEYALYSLELIGGEVQDSGDFIFKQFDLAQENLVNAERNVNEFDVRERLALMQIELTEDQNQLESHYAQVHKLSFTLEEKENRLRNVVGDIAAMTKDGVWLGALRVTSADEKQYDDVGLSSSQKALRQKALKAELTLAKSKNERDTFINESKIHSIREDVVRRRKDLLDDKSVLSQVERLCEATKVNLQSKGSLDMLKHLEGPIAENLSDLTIWEILSLIEGYNFFETRKQSLAAKLGEQEKELKDLEKALFEYEDKQKTLDENVTRAQLNYDFYFNKLKSLEDEKNTTELEVASIQSDLSYSRELVKKLEEDVKILKTAINEKKAKLSELNRELEICKRTYGLLSSKLEEARIAKALELGEVKVVSTAFEPKYPVGPRRRLTVAVAGVIGLILGVLAAFFRNSGRRTTALTNAEFCSGREYVDR